MEWNGMEWNGMYYVYYENKNISTAPVMPELTQPSSFFVFPRVFRAVVCISP